MADRRTLAFAAVVAMLAFFLGVALKANPAAAASLTFTVDSQNDVADAQPGDGTCATSAGGCTLRAAIEEANLHTGPDTIAFNIPGPGVRTIQLASPLPDISDTTGGTTIDGYTQPGSSPNTDPQVSNATIMVEITTSAGTYTNSRGLFVTSPGNTIRGLALFKVKNPIQLNGSGARNNTVVGNFVGTNAAGDYAAIDYTAAGDGILMIHGPQHNTVGGTSAADRNVVSGNSRRGVVITGETTDFNRVINNIVGLGPGGDKRLGNIKHGVDLNSGASDNVIGGTQPGERNVLSGNGWAGIEVSHLPETVNNRVIGNFIGTGVTGNTAPAYTSNGEQGVHLQDQVRNNEVTGNVIGNNGEGGIRAGQNVLANQIHDNWIGVSFDNSPIPNSVAGVKLGSNSDSNHVGPNNTIANNPVGILVTTDDSDFNTFTRNSIFGNGGRGIDLSPGGPNPNDPGDADGGANEQLNFPDIGRATPEKVTGSVCSGCTVEVFLADRGSNKVYGEGKTFVGSATANIDGTFAVTISGVVAGNYVTATATDAAGNTSEFSLNQAVTTASDTTPPETSIVSGPQEGSTTGGSVTFAFSSSEPGSSFECSLDGGSFSSCASPTSYNLADGPHTFEVKATDPDGNADTTPAGRAWTVDATAPTVQPPARNLITNSTLGTSTIPVKLTWSATDGGTGVSEYKLQQSTNGGDFATVPISTTSTTSTRQLSPGNTYQFRVQARDQVGNWSDWAYGSVFSVNDYQEASSAVTYVGTWTSEALSSAYGGSLNYATASGSDAQFSFTGRSVTWVATKNADRGKATVWIDGVKVSTVDLYSSVEKPRTMVFTQNDLDPSQTHTLEVRVSGNKNAASSGTRVDVDAFVVLG